MQTELLSTPALYGLHGVAEVLHTSGAAVSSANKMAPNAIVVKKRRQHGKSTISVADGREHDGAATER